VRPTRFSDATIGFVLVVIAKLYLERVFGILESSLNRTSAGLESIITKALHRVPPDESALLAWPVACGSPVAERTRALSFSDGILRVEVADAGWRRELSGLAPRYLALVNKYSAAWVKRIEFVVKA
jgi:hypothetical protein